LQQKIHVEMWSKQHIDIMQLNQLTTNTIAKAGHMQLLLKFRVVALTDIAKNACCFCDSSHIIYILEAFLCINL
jgi:hypothetical protein